MKKNILLLIIVTAALLLSSCGLIKCSHKKCTERVVAPTCEIDGYTEYTCNKCGEIFSDNIVSKLGHSYTGEVVAPNCFEEGYTKNTCANCGGSYNDNTVAKTHHYFVGAACPNCGMEEITENITPDTEWYSEEILVFNLTTKEQLAGFASLVNSGTNFEGCTVYLDADISLDYYEWIPIGNEEHSFNGKFDGDGHTITGLKINANIDYVGLFGKTVGVITNLNITEANIFVKRDHNHVSILCGYSTGEISKINAQGFIEAPKSNFVGAIVGSAVPSSVIYSKLSANAQIKGADSVGGIFGAVNGSGSVQTDDISYAGSVKGNMQIGGIIGYTKASVGSKIYGAKVSADVVGEYCVGGIVGKAENVAISTCSNEGSTVTANFYLTQGENFFAYLGGYVGYGYSVDNCVNNIDITYTARGSYVGGIAGYVTGQIIKCENNGDITSNGSYVGGISGMANTPGELSFFELSNTGNISGISVVGGIMGCLYQNSNSYSDVECEKKYKDHELVYGQSSYYHYYYSNTSLSLISNSGVVSALKENAGGIIGVVSLISTFDRYNVVQCCAYSKTISCEYHADSRLIATDISNTGDVLGLGKSGEIFGSFSTEKTSTLTNYTVTGKVTVNGEALEGTYDVGANSNLTLSEREIYVEESTGENTEASE